ncbi:hypothetical protein HN011_007229 [Eciton burchellii]|nr:hypothetical protein HN011_007229 [Eciton burchellii]
MDFDGNRYYTINRVMLSCIGLWPYQNSPWSLGIQRFCCLVGFLTFLICQLLTFATCEYNMDLLLEVLSFAIPYLIVILKYISFCMKTESMRKIMDMIKYDWNVLRNRIEYETIHKYSYIGALYAQLFALIAYIVPVLFACGHFISDIDSIMPFNQSHSYQLLILAEYFVNNEKYFYFIVLHATVCFFLFQITLMSTTSIYVAYIQHICGMFRIASYRIEHALDDYENSLISGRHCIACARIISAIDIHRRVIMFLEFISDTFGIMYFCLLCLGMASLTVNIYRAVTTKGFLNHIISVISILIHLYYFFLVNYSGQKVLDHSSIFLSRTYKSKWHVMPLHVQKLILFIMQKNTRNYMLVIGGIYVASLEGFATALSTSISYFMVIYSTR